MAEWPPYCGAERLFTPTAQPTEVVAVCTRAPHPATEQHVDIERSICWPEPGHFVRNPFMPSPGT